MTLVAAPSTDRFLADLDRLVTAIADGAAERDRERRYPAEAIEALRELGFWALLVPAELGGPGHGHDVVVQAVVALSSADGSLGQLPQNHFMGLERIRLTGTADQQERYLGAVARGAFLGNATAEPGERHLGEHATRVVRRDSGWELSGRKVYATGALLAEYIVVSAPGPGDEVFSVVVERDARGVRIVDDWDGLGQRTTASGQAIFDAVAVDDIAVLAPVADPVAAYRISALGQLLHAAIDAGIAEGALAESVRLAKVVHAGRGSGVRAFTDDVLGVARLGELKIQVLAARRVVESVADRLARFDERSPLADVLDAFYEVAAAKVLSTRAALEVSTALFEIGGTSSTRAGNGLDRHWRDARTHTVHDAVRQKPHTVGTWLLADVAADPWSIGHPYTPVHELEARRTRPDGRTS